MFQEPKEEAEHAAEEDFSGLRQIVNSDDGEEFEPDTDKQDITCFLRRGYFSHVSALPPP